MTVNDYYNAAHEGEQMITAWLFRCCFVVSADISHSNLCLFSKIMMVLWILEH